MATNIPGPPPVAPPPKKGGALKFMLIGCGAALVLGILIVGGLVFYGVHKVKQAGFDPDLMKRNPAFATAKMLATLNKDSEILSADESSGIIVIRDKKTGKKLTIDVAETSKKHSIVFRGEGGEEMSIGQSGEGSMSIKTKEGTTTIGSGSAAKLPSWLPAYPSPSGETKFAVQSDQGGSFGFSTSDSAGKVADFYEQSFKGAGLSVTKTTMPSGAMVMGDDQATKRSAMANATTQDGKTQVSITYETKK